MAIEQSHGVARPTLPRSSDLAVTVATPDRSQGRDASGRFAPRHGLSYTKSWHLQMAEALGVDLGGEASTLARAAYRAYRAFARELPATSPRILSSCAAHARAATLAAFFARRALSLGLGSEEAEAVLRQAATWDQRSERLSVTTWDLAVRAAKATKNVPIDATPWLVPDMKDGGT